MWICHFTFIMQSKTYRDSCPLLGFTATRRQILDVKLLLYNICLSSTESVLLILPEYKALDEEPIMQKVADNLHFTEDPNGWVMLPINPITCLLCLLNVSAYVRYTWNSLIDTFKLVYHTVRMKDLRGWRYTSVVRAECLSSVLKPWFHFLTLQKTNVMMPIHNSSTLKEGNRIINSNLSLESSIWYIRAYISMHPNIEHSSAYL